MLNKPIYRIILFLIIVLLSLAAGFLIPIHLINKFFRAYSYYILFFTFFLWFFLIIKRYVNDSITIIKKHYLGLILSFAIVILIFNISPPKYKVMADEANLANVAMSMFQNKTISLSLEDTFIIYDNTKYPSSIDKRPLLYPFLVSILHTILGYNADNSFLLNFIVCICILFSFYLFIQKFFPKIYGFISILLIASCPAFVIWGTSGGFDILNMFFVVLIFVLFYEFLKDKMAENAEILLLTLILLFQSRYESIIFAIALFFLMPQLFAKKTINKFSFTFYSFPFLLLPIMWQRRIFFQKAFIVKNGDALIQFSDFQSIFSVQNFISNFSKNIFVFLGLNPHYGFTPFISILSIIGFYILIRRIVLHIEDSSIIPRSLMVFGLSSFLMLIVIFFSYKWGNFTSNLSNRFVLVFIPYIIFTAIYCLYVFIADPGYSKKIGLVTIFVFHLLLYWPYGSQNKVVDNLSLTYEYNKIMDYMKTSFGNNKKLFIISDHPNLFLIHKYGSISFSTANKLQEASLINMARNFDHSLIIERYAKGSNKPVETVNHSEKLVVKELKSIQITYNMYVKILEINTKGG